MKGSNSSIKNKANKDLCLSKNQNNFENKDYSYTINVTPRIVCKKTLDNKSSILPLTKTISSYENDGKNYIYIIKCSRSDSFNHTIKRTIASITKLCIFIKISVSIFITKDIEHQSLT